MPGDEQTRVVLRELSRAVWSRKRYGKGSHSVSLDLAPSKVQVNVIIDDTPHAHNVNERVQRIRSDRAKAAALESDTVSQTAILVHELTADGFPVRDIATLAGISYQRVSQLLKHP